MKITIAAKKKKRYYHFQNNSYKRRPDAILIFVFDSEELRSGSIFFPNSPNPNDVIQYLEMYFFHIFMTLLCHNSKWNWGRISHTKLLIGFV